MGLELSLLAAVGYGGYETAVAPLNCVLMIAFPLAVAVVGSAVAALGATGQVALAVILAALVAGHLALTFGLGQRPGAR